MEVGDGPAKETKTVLAYYLNYTLPLPGPKPTTHQQVSAHTFNLIIGTLATIWNFPPEHSLRDLVTFNKISVYGHVRVLGGGDSI